MPLPTIYPPEVQSHIQRIATDILALSLVPKWSIVSAINAVSSAARKLNDEYILSLMQESERKKE